MTINLNSVTAFYQFINNHEIAVVHVMRDNCSVYESDTCYGINIIHNEYADGIFSD